VAIALGALLFAVRHLDPVRFAPLVLLGAVFGWLAWRGGSLWPAIAAHAANNAVASAIALAVPDRAGADAAEPGAGALVLILAGGGALVAAILAAYRRATPAPSTPEAYVTLRDPADPSTRFRFGAVPERLVRAAFVGLAALLALSLGTALWERAAAP
jgi:hypothetical protein